MGGAFSCGENNDDLVNILILLGYITSKKVERVFRAVDRGDYVLPSHRDLAYKDLSWKLGNIHLSAPCVYCKVMQGLTLKPGLSFLNIGSGTGYLSTMAGLILGKNGTNHGIEMHEDCMMYAYEHLETFKRKYLDVDSFEFCEPVFQLGNILNVTTNRQYDRVYCGAACPESHEQYIKQFVKVGGILVMPYKDNLLRIERLGENTWQNITMLPVSFASLVTPSEGKDGGLLQLPLCQPYTLQELCRSSIRCHLRKLVWLEHSDLEYKAEIKAEPIERTLSQIPLGIPFFEEPNRGQSDSDRSDSDDDENERRPTFFDIEARRQQLSTTRLRLIRAVVQPNQGNENREDAQRETNEDSGEAEHPESRDDDNTTKETANHETAMQEDFFEPANHAPTISWTVDEDDLMVTESVTKDESDAEEKETHDVEMKNCDRNLAQSARSSDLKLKRKSEAIGSNNELHNSQRYRLSDENNVPDENSSQKTTTFSENHIEPHNSQRYCLTVENDVPGENSSSKAPTTSSADLPVSNSDTDDEESPNFDWISTAISILNDKLEAEIEQSSGSSSTSDTSDDESAGNVPVEILKNLVGAESDSDGDNRDFLMNLLESAIEKHDDSKNSESRGNGSTLPADKDPTKDVNSRNSDDTETDEDENKESMLREKFENSWESLSDDETNEITALRRSLKPEEQKRPEQRSESSDSNESSNNSSASDCSVSTDTQEEFDFNYIHRRNLIRKGIRKSTYAHAYRKEQIAHFMQRKVGRLPLPLPLRLYLNYNREFEFDDTGFDIY